mmetsp:Transcript_13332/g.28839  ORF Transcript_13332/g.28839 Transcript_13332/m.28839 type:complete len:117 (-) Transcript_13332:169-519(-)
MFRASEQPKELNVGLFKSGFRPLWEDFESGGGQYFVKIPQPDRRSTGTHLNEKWENLLLALVCEQFNDPNIVGALLSTRTTKYDVIQLWTTGPRRLITAAKFINILGLDVSSENIV